MKRVVIKNEQVEKVANLLGLDYLLRTLLDAEQRAKPNALSSDIVIQVPDHHGEIARTLGESEECVFIIQAFDLLYLFYKRSLNSSFSRSEYYSLVNGLETSHLSREEKDEVAGKLKAHTLGF